MPFTVRRGWSGCRSGAARKRPVTDSGFFMSASASPSATTWPPRLPAPGPRSMTWCGAPDRLLVVLDDEQRVALRLELRERVEQDRGCRAGAGRSSARRGCSRRRAGSSRAARRAGCAALRRRRASAPSGRARDRRARPRRGSRGATRARRGCRARSRPRGPRARARGRSAATFADRQRGQVGDRPVAEAHGERHRVEALALGTRGRARRRPPTMRSTRSPRRSAPRRSRESLSPVP